MKFTLEIAGKRASELNPDWILNCFAVVKCFLEGELANGALSAQEFLEWLQVNTSQVDVPAKHDLFVVWLAEENGPAIQNVRIADLLRDSPGYPFGLIMEHAGVLISKDEAFHKASSSDDHRFESENFQKICKQYHSHKWHKITFHRFNSR